MLDDVSCASARLCLLAGSAGTTRKTAHGLSYLSHASAFRWTGSALRQPKVPAPAGARASELAAVSCPTTTSCLAVGNYTGPAGRSLPYAALWDGGTWRLRLAPDIRGKASTVFQGVSCAAAARCVVVGDAVTPGSAAFAERYAAGTWTVPRLAAGAGSALYSVSCPAATRCVAAGQRGTRPRIEAWNGTRWAAQSVPLTVAPLTTDSLLHVSCVTATSCTAVGYRHDPKARFSFHTLAVGFNGTKRTIQKTLSS